MTARSALRVDDHEAIRKVLAGEPVAAAYLLGDLDPAYQPFCTWYLSGTPAEDDAVLLVYTALSAPVVLAHGATAGIATILECFVRELPERAHVHMAPEHLPVFDQHFNIDNLRPMLRMGLQAEDPGVIPEVAGDDPGVETLGHRDTGEIMELFGHYPDSFFEPSQLSSGHYYGIRRGGRLVSVAGVHICSRDERIAVLGNIVTHPDFRSRGLSTACTAHLCRRLLSEGIGTLALNVARRNFSAVHIYEKLGFRECCTYLEGFLQRTLDYRVR